MSPGFEGQMNKRWIFFVSTNSEGIEMLTIRNVGL